jgi:medium-chain acyl-[acyl-carrier-protein] hydrolase
MHRQQNDSGLVTVRPNPRARLRLFCFPCAGGGAAVYYRWRLDLPPEIDVCPIQLPGREDRLHLAPFTRLEPLVDELTRVLTRHASLPFALFGHSLGALVAFELARQLRQRGNQGPVQLFVAAARAPHLASRAPQIHQWEEAAFLVEVRLRYGGIPAPILQDPELLRLYLSILRTDMEILESYVYAPDAPLDCPIAAFGGLEDAAITREEVAAWGVQTRHPFSLRMLSGNHFFLHTARPAFLRAIAQDLTGIAPST